MSDYPNDVRYTKEHEWARKEGDLVRVGVTAFAVDQLGDVADPGQVAPAVPRPVHAEDDQQQVRRERPDGLAFETGERLLAPQPLAG